MMIAHPTIDTTAVELFCDQHGLLPRDTHVVVALSGGADSVFLLHVLCALRITRNIRLVAAHLNHEWREQADNDEEFCRNLATMLEVPFVSNRLSHCAIPPKDANGSKEALGRLARRAFLESIRTQYGADYIALAHNAQDQLETFLIRVMRGTSLTGLVGMRPKTDHYIRPLLATAAQWLRTELIEHGIAFVEDQSNASLTFLRNRIRHVALPALRSCDNRFERMAGRTLERLADTESFLTELTAQYFAALQVIWSEETWISLTILRAHHRVMQQRLVVHWLCEEQVPFPASEAFLLEVLRFLHNPHGGTHIIHCQWYIYKRQQHAVIRRGTLHLLASKK
jgi:tRNA(Ile)-lysidine synthase